MDKLTINRIAAGYYVGQYHRNQVTVLRSSSLKGFFQWILKINSDYIVLAPTRQDAIKRAIEYIEGRECGIVYS